VSVFCRFGKLLHCEVIRRRAHTEAFRGKVYRVRSIEERGFHFFKISRRGKKFCHNFPFLRFLERKLGKELPSKKPLFYYYIAVFAALSLCFFHKKLGKELPSKKAIILLLHRRFYIMYPYLREEQAPPVNYVIYCFSTLQ
jgi:hypothetical protein